MLNFMKILSGVLESPEIVKTEILAKAELLGLLGLNLKRLHANTLNGFNYANMKEFRFSASDGVWRVAFAIDYLFNGLSPMKPLSSISPNSQNPNLSRKVRSMKKSFKMD